MLSPLLIVEQKTSVIVSKKGGKRPPPFLLAIWGSGGRRFKSDHPDQRVAKPLFLIASKEDNGEWGADIAPPY